MKDRKLQEKFDEYFKGVNPPENITADAKKYVKAKKPFMPRFLRFAAIAASVALVSVVTVLGLYYNSLPKGDGAAPPAADEPSSPDAPQITFYGDEDLQGKEYSAYELFNVHRSLKFLQDLNYNNYASVDGCTAYTLDGALTLVKSDVSLLKNLNRYESRVYVEFVTNKVYSPLADYGSGKAQHYKGTAYCVTQTFAQNGEPEFKLHFTRGGVKYYFDIISSDPSAYLPFLQLILD